MEERGCVRETVDGYALTAYGKRLLRNFVEFAERAESIHHLQPFLRRVPPQEFGVDVSHLEDARVTTASANDPYAPLQRQVDIVQTAREFRLCADILGRNLFEQICSRIADHGCEGELVLTADALETFESEATFADLYAELTRTERVQIYEFPGTLAYALGIVDDSVQISVEDDRNHVHALVETDASAVREWAEERYAAYKQRADPVV